MAQKRIVVYENNEIHYLLEQKQVKNLNLRVHKDCKVYVSANPDVPAEKVDDFVVSKGAYIRSAQRKFREMAQYAPQPKQYVSGETFYLLGRGIRLKVENNMRDAISSDGIYLRLCVKDTEDFVRRRTPRADWSPWSGPPGWYPRPSPAGAAGRWGPPPGAG